MKTGKVLCVLLAAAVLFSLCACGDSTASVSGDQTVTTGPSASGNVTASGSDPAKDAAGKPAEEPEKKDEDGFSVGSSVNNTYENAYFGIGVRLDDNWVFTTQEEIDEINSQVQDIMDDDNYAEALEKGTVYTDMSASANEGLINMSATIEKLNAISTIAVDEEDYVDATLQNYDFKALFEEMGIDLSVAEKGSVRIAGEEHPCVVIEGSIQGVGFFEKVAAIKKGNYVLSITVASIMENVVDDVFAYFYAL